MSKTAEVDGTQIWVAHRCLLTLRKIRAAYAQESVNPQTAVQDAQKLAGATAELLIDNFESPTEGQIEACLQTLNGITPRYHRYRGLTRNRHLLSALFHAGVIYNSAKFFVEKAAEIGSDPTLSDFWLSMPELKTTEAHFGILAPLSMDYFHAALLQRSIAIHRDHSNLKLKPLIFGRTICPNDPRLLAQYDPEFDQQTDGMVIFLEQEGYGKTRILCNLAARTLYPNKTLHPSLAAL